MRCFDKDNNRIVYIERLASSTFWDSHWREEFSARDTLLRTRDNHVTRVTKRYLKPQDGPVLEGGCGTGRHVAALHNSGFRCIGLDYAEESVSRLRQAVPELDIRWGRLQELDFPSGHFAGYWSLGVIEHYWNGYEQIGREMARVIAPGGYLFLTFPYMSPLRSLKARLRCYPMWRGSRKPDDFYQFALDHRTVVLDFEEWGFRLVEFRPLNGLKGTKDEIPALKPLLQRLHDYRGKSLLIRGLRYVLTRMLASFAGHVALLVLVRDQHPSRSGLA